jgi:hypothetical protein
VFNFYRHKEDSFPLQSNRVLKTVAIFCCCAISAHPSQRDPPGTGKFFQDDLTLTAVTGLGDHLVNTVF